MDAQHSNGLQTGVQWNAGKSHHCPMQCRQASSLTISHIIVIPGTTVYAQTQTSLISDKTANNLNYLTNRACHRQAISQIQLEHISTHLTQPIPHHSSRHSISHVCVFENDQWRLSPQLHGNLHVTTWSSAQIIVISHFMKCKFTNVRYLACCPVLESQISSSYMQ